MNASFNATDASKLTRSVSMSDLLILPFGQCSPKLKQSEHNTLVNSSLSSTPKFLAITKLAVSWEF